MAKARKTNEQATRMVIAKLVKYHERDEAILTLARRIKQLEFENGVLKSELAEAHYQLQLTLKPIPDGTVNR